MRTYNRWNNVAEFRSVARFDEEKRVCYVGCLDMKGHEASVINTSFHRVLLSVEALMR
jgi:hypothetical protein